MALRFIFPNFQSGKFTVVEQFFDEIERERPSKTLISPDGKPVIVSEKVAVVRRLEHDFGKEDIGKAYFDFHDEEAVLKENPYHFKKVKDEKPVEPVAAIVLEPRLPRARRKPSASPRRPD